MSHFLEKHEEWGHLQKRCRNILQREESLREVAEVVGMEGLQDNDRLIMRTAEKIRLEFLCQNCFSEDAYATPQNTVEKITALLIRHDELNDALNQGALLDDLFKEERNETG